MVIGFARAGKIAVTLAQRTGAFASGRSYIQRYFPPGYREPALKLVRAFEQAATGAGLFQVYNTFMSADDSPGNGSSPPRTGYEARKSDKTRSRYPERISGRNKKRGVPYCKPRRPNPR